MNEKKAKRIRKECMRTAKPREPMRKYAWMGGQSNTEKGVVGTIILVPDCTLGRIRAAKKLACMGW
ncbi:MAG: hypothetical protein HQL80_05525 [Magnetococcales bacterium]|nr:hypothetical protein [Magnetococcales bacterium]